MGGPGPLMERVMIYLGVHAVGLFVRIFSRLKVTGWENIPSGPGVLFLSNHISALDVLVVPWCIYQRWPQGMLRQAGKEELFRIPVVGWVLAKWRGFPVRRGGGDITSIRAIGRYIREGKVILYPEGTRSRDGRLRRGNRMVGRIIRDTRPTVIPVAVRGTDRVVPVGKTLPRRGAEIEVRFGEPLDLEAECAIEDAKESSTRVIARVMEGIARLLEEGDSPPRELAAAEKGRE